MKATTVLLILAGTVLFGRAPAEEQARVDYYTLGNGLRVFLQEKPTVPLIHACLAVNIGVKDEDDATSGHVHLLEHMILFGGSEKRSAERKALDIRRLGGIFNAHTDHDLMTIELTLGSGDAAMLPEWLAEFAYAPALSAEEIEGEKKIILQEISQIQDNPDTCATDLLLQNLFTGHVYGRPVYGRPETVSAAGPGQLRKLHQAYFVPGNCALSMVGRFDLASMKKRIDECFAAIKANPPPVPALVQATPLRKKGEWRREMDIERAHLKIAYLAPHFNHPERTAVSILTHLLGQGRNPLLFRAVAAERDDVESLNVRYLAFKYGGAVVVHAIVKPGGLKRIKSAITGFLSSASSFNWGREDFLPDERRFVTDYLQCGKNLLLLAAENAREEGARLAVSYATFLLLNEQTLAEEFADKVARVKSSDLRIAAGHCFGGKPYVTVEILPGGAKKDDEKE